MKNRMEIEEAAMTVIAIYFIAKLDLRINWWWYIPLFFSPDISLIGLVLQNKAGEFIYTFFHHKAVAIIAGSIGLLLEMDYLSLAGLILFGHSSFDRVLGFRVIPTTVVQHNSKTI